MSDKLPLSRPTEVFISYARDDKRLKERFVKHLAALKHQGLITAWHDHKIVAGDDWNKETNKHLNSAGVILLLVSSNFLASDFAYDIEFQRARERHKRGEARVIPVILRPCEWKGTPLGEFQAVPEDGKPVVEWKTIDAGFANVIEGLKKALRELPDKQPPSTNEDDASEIILTFPGFPDNFNLKDFKQALRTHLGIDVERITISVRRGSVKVVLEGDAEELSRIVEALRDPITQEKFARHTSLISISYTQNQHEHTIPVERVGRALSLTPVEVLRQAIRAVPAVKYALGVAGIAAAVTIVAGFSRDYRVAVLGTITMLGLMFGLVLFSWFAKNSPASIKTLALTLAWTFVVLISATSLFIFTSFFLSWPQPLQTYLHTPSPTPTLTPIASPSPSASVIAGAVGITITEVPPYDPVGGAKSTAHIAGKVTGVNPKDYKVVIYSFTITWYVQPTITEPKTDINSDGTWDATIQLGSKYVALLVYNNYNPPYTTSTLPTRLSGVIASTQVEGKK